VLYPFGKFLYLQKLDKSGKDMLEKANLIFEREIRNKNDKRLNKI
jgi:hypothetical protein